MLGINLYTTIMKAILCIKFDLFKIKNTDFWAAYGRIYCLIMSKFIEITRKLQI